MQISIELTKKKKMQIFKQPDHPLSISFHHKFKKKIQRKKIRRLTLL